MIIKACCTIFITDCAISYNRKKNFNFVLDVTLIFAAWKIYLEYHRMMISEDTDFQHCFPTCIGVLKYFRDVPQWHLWRHFFWTSCRDSQPIPPETFLEHQRMRQHANGAANISAHLLLLWKLNECVFAGENCCHVSFLLSCLLFPIALQYCGYPQILAVLMIKQQQSSRSLTYYIRPVRKKTAISQVYFWHHVSPSLHYTSSPTVRALLKQKVSCCEVLEWTTIAENDQIVHIFSWISFMCENSSTHFYSLFAGENLENLAPSNAMIMILITIPWRMLKILAF